MIFPFGLPTEILYFLFSGAIILGVVSAGLRGVTVYTTQEGLTLPRWYPHQTGLTAFFMHMLVGTVIGATLTIVYLSFGAAVAREVFPLNPTFAYLVTPIFTSAIVVVLLEAFKMRTEVREIYQLHVGIHAVLYVGTVILLAFL